MTVFVTANGRELDARALVATALAAAFSDPKAPLCEKGRAIPGSVLRAEWDVVAGRIGAFDAADLHRGERRPDEVDANAVATWLSLGGPRRERAYREVFGLVVGKTCPPVENEYVPWKDSTHRAQQLADVAGFYRAFGVMPDRTFPEHLDHVVLELSFVAFLLEKRARIASVAHDEDPRGAIATGALRSFLADHIVWWMPVFAHVVGERIAGLLVEVENAELEADLADFRACARMLAAFVRSERLIEAVGPPAGMAPARAGEDDESECGGCGLAT